jgi:hypothetical protein
MMDDKIRDFKSQNFVKPKVSAVYGIYSRDGECLWIGESENLYSRLDDHYHSSRGSTIRGCVENDEKIDLSVDELWEKTMLKTFTVSGKSKRKRLESHLIKELEPRYNSQSGSSVNQQKSVEGRGETNRKESASRKSSRYDIPNTFRKFVLSWDWPDPPSSGTRQAENVISVVYRLMMMDEYSPEGFTTALQNRADEARNANPSLGERYEDTVRDSCVRGLGFREQDATRETATKDFLAESRKLTREYKKEYR